jgi:hypothetical protein
LRHRQTGIVESRQDDGLTSPGSELLAAEYTKCIATPTSVDSPERSIPAAAHSDHRGGLRDADCFQNR